MDSILNADFDFDNPQIAFRGDYYAKVTKMLSGGVEVVLKCVRPMMQENRAEQFANCFPVSNRPKEEKSASEIEHEKRANHRRAVRKAKQTTRFLVEQMQADRLFTLTYRENVDDREKVKADFKRFLRLVREGWKGCPGIDNWQYVAVLERQERGAYHVHCAVRGYQPVKFLRKCWYKALGADAEAKGEDTPGQVDITSPRNSTGKSRKREWATRRLSCYIVKYMQKTFDETTTEKNRYWRSKDIEAPQVYRQWLVATNLGEAISALYKHLEIAEGFRVQKHWNSDDQCIYWCYGIAEAE